MSFPEIDAAHGELVSAVRALTKPGADPIPITVVSVSEGAGSQLVCFDGSRWDRAEVAKRLRLAAAMLSPLAADESGKAGDDEG